MDQNNWNSKFLSGNEPELTVGAIYHLKNGFAKSLEYLWFKDCELESIENWNGIKIYTFREQSTGHPICIDGDVLFKYDKQITLHCYQYIPKN